MLETENLKRFASGAVRGTDADGTRYDLISPVLMRRLAETYAEGAKKYGDNNWKKGIPISDLLNHALRHIFMFLDGDTSEDHLAHAMWNIGTAAHFEERMNPAPPLVNAVPLSRATAVVSVEDF